MAAICHVQIEKIDRESENEKEREKERETHCKSNRTEY